MDNLPVTTTQAARGSPAGRAVLAALLLAAVALAIFAVDIQYAQADVIVAATNFVANGSFEKDSNHNGVPNNWFGEGTLTSSDKRVCNQSKVGDCSFKMVGDNDTKWLVQCRGYTGTDAGNEFELKAWTKGKALMLGGGEAKIFVDFYNGASLVNSTNVDVGAGTFPWTLRQLSSTAAADYDGICIYLQIDADSGTIWFDKVSFVYVGGP